MPTELNPTGRVIFLNLMLRQPVNKFPAFDAVCNFSNVFSNIRHFFTSSARQIQSMPLYSIGLGLFSSTSKSFKCSVPFRFLYYNLAYISVLSTLPACPAFLIFFNLDRRCMTHILFIFTYMAPPCQPTLLKCNSVLCTPYFI